MEPTQSFESLVTQWFNKWGIGSADDNFGILIFVGFKERKARIELGSGWGKSRNINTDEIMNEVLVPYFKRGEYSAGILATVGHVSNLAERRPANTTTHRNRVEERNHQIYRFFFGKVALPIELSRGLVILGIATILLSLVFPKHWKAFAITGCLLILFVFLSFFAALITFAIVAKELNLSARGNGSGHDGGFDGGSSDGGGSSGSW